MTCLRSKLDEYREARAAVGKRLQEAMAAADEPGIVADVVLHAADAARPKLRYTAGRVASRLRWLRKFALASWTLGFGRISGLTS